jgi:hypothetical protein
MVILECVVSKNKLLNRRKEGYESHQSSIVAPCTFVVANGASEVPGWPEL